MRWFKKKNITTKEFWEWFNHYQDEYYRLNEQNLDTLFHKLGEKLHLVHEDLTFEFSADLIEGKRQFVISADGFQEAFPSVKKLVGDATLDKDKWDIIAFRPRNGLNDVEYEGVTVKPNNLFFSYEYTSTRKVELNIYVKDIDVKDETIGAIFILLDNLLGEYDVAIKIGNIDFYEYTFNHNLHSVEKLKEIVDAI